MRKILIVDSREPSLHIQLAVMGFAFDSVCEKDAVKSMSENEYLFVLIEATERGFKFAQAISTLQLSEKRLPPPIIGIQPIGMSLAASEALPPGIADMVSRPIRTDVLYESICCLGTSLEPEKMHPQPKKSSVVTSHRSDKPMERFDNFRDQPAASNASCILDNRREASSARGWQRSSNPFTAPPSSRNGVAPVPLLPMHTSRAVRCGAARGTSQGIWRGQMPPSVPSHHCYPACLPSARAEGATNVTAMN
jgi:hypothetical protein